MRFIISLIEDIFIKWITLLDKAREAVKGTTGTIIYDKYWVE